MEGRVEGVGGWKGGREGMKDRGRGWRMEEAGGEDRKGRRRGWKGAEGRKREKRKKVNVKAVGNSQM